MVFVLDLAFSRHFWYGAYNLITDHFYIAVRLPLILMLGSCSIWKLLLGQNVSTIAKVGQTG